MANTSGPTQEKRRRERSRQESKQQKGLDREARKEQKKTRLENLKPGEDPDLIGIVAGPQAREDEEDEPRGI
jgi:hypothetical protein